MIILVEMTGNRQVCYVRVCVLGVCVCTGRTMMEKGETYMYVHMHVHGEYPYWYLLTYVCVCTQEDELANLTTE